VFLLKRSTHWTAILVTQDPVTTYDQVAEDGIPVELPSGATYYTITHAEAEYLRDRIERYMADNHFINVSDIQEIDRLITLETLVHRWTMWISKGRNYYDEDINVKQHSDMVQDASREIRQMKKAIGLDKPSRDKVRGDDSIAAYWDHLLRRAREFGYMRNEQVEQVITSFQRIKALIQFYDNTDEIERKENACELDDIFEVLREEIKTFDQIDEAFRHKKQTLWIRNQ
jgi:hypothetical protein